MAGKRKKTPPSLDLIRQLNIDPTLGYDFVTKQVSAIVDQIHYAGDLKQIAERYGLHYLQSKRMRRRELAQWIKKNHPAIKAWTQKTM